MIQWQEIGTLVQRTTGVGFDPRTLATTAIDVADPRRTFDLREGKTPGGVA
jgi:hypothetical protein